MRNAIANNNINEDNTMENGHHSARCRHCYAKLANLGRIKADVSHYYFESHRDVRTHNDEP